MCSYTSIEAFSLDGFPHSESHGSRLACSSPWIFAAYRVFRRLLVPRHSPYALRSLIFLLAFSQCFLPNFKNILFINNTSSCFAFISSLFSFQGTKYECLKGIHGGGKESRTPDPLLARQVLYQLSYTPI